MSLHRILTGRRTRRDVDDERQAEDAARYFQHVKAAVASMDELGPEPETDPDAPTTTIPVITSAPEPGMRQRPRVHVDAPGWTEEDVRARSREIAEHVAAARQEAAAERPVDELPVPKRRHPPAVGAWFAHALKPVPLPAIPDADRYRVAPMPTVDEVEDGPCIESGRLALEAAASTHHFADEQPTGEHPEDYIEWLRQEFAEIDARCTAALAEHQAATETDLAALDLGYFQDADLQLAELNTMTLPGWTNLETALYNAGVFAS